MDQTATLNDDRQAEPAELESNDTLAKCVAPAAASHPGLSGLLPLREGREAFAARSLLADSAERTLDVQYYIWRNDMAGTLLLDSLRRAADRGVKVRLLLDDINTAGLDGLLAALDAYPNFEVRLFNPFRHRRFRIIDYLTRFGRVNHRMHNKSFTADGQVTIIGGRNVGNEYFDAGNDVLFVDLDVVAVGPVVADVACDFEKYWNSSLVVRVSSFLPPADADAIERMAKAADEVRRSEPAIEYVRAIEQTLVMKGFLCGDLPMEWAKTTMLSDDPRKALDRAPVEKLVWSRLRAAFGNPSESIDLISPYFVPGKSGTRYLLRLAADGVRVRVLTNALEATDVPAVHSGYAKRRRRLLPYIALYEMKRLAPRPITGRRFKGSSSKASLHAKVFAVDGKKAFVGSFNFDPRSARLNTELGFLVESPVLAAAIAEGFGGRIQERSYELRRAQGEGLEWIERKDGTEIVHHSEPGTSWWLRLVVGFLSRLPIEWLL